MDHAISQPVTFKERIISLDVLRGVAILGILLMNSVSFSMVMGAYESPVVYNDMEGVDWWTWLILHFIADQKFVSIFSIQSCLVFCNLAQRAATFESYRVALFVRYSLTRN